MPDHNFTDDDLDREFGDLITELRAERPEIDPDFAGKLDADLAKLTTQAPKAGVAGVLDRVRDALAVRPPMSVLSGLATALLALAIALPVAVTQIIDGGGSDDTSPALSVSDGGAEPEAAAYSAGAAADRTAAPSAGSGAEAPSSLEREGAPTQSETVAPGAVAGAAGEIAPDADAARSAGGGSDVIAPLPTPPGQGDILPGRTRRVERSASVVLEADADEIEETADNVLRVVDEVGGIVMSSNVSSGDGQRGRATFDVRVPVAKLQQTLRELSEVAHVKSRSQGAFDVTRVAVSAADRLADARAERRALLRALAKADTENETASIRARLRIAAQEIASAQGDVRRIGDRTSFAAVSVTVEAKGESPGFDDDPDGWSLGDAWDNTKDVLEVLAGIGLVGLAVLLPALLLGSAAWFGMSRTTRRRREKALDAD